MGLKLSVSSGNRVLGLSIITYAWSFVNALKSWVNPLKARNNVSIASLVSLGQCIYDHGGQMYDSYN